MLCSAYCVSPCSPRGVMLCAWARPVVCGRDLLALGSSTVSGLPYLCLPLLLPVRHIITSCALVRYLSLRGLTVGRLGLVTSSLHLGYLSACVSLSFVCRADTAILARHAPHLHVSRGCCLSAPFAVSSIPSAHSALTNREAHQSACANVPRPLRSEVRRDTSLVRVGTQRQQVSASKQASKCE